LLPLFWRNREEGAPRKSERASQKEVGAGGDRRTPNASGMGKGYGKNLSGALEEEEEV